MRDVLINDDPMDPVMKEVGFLWVQLQVKYPAPKTLPGYTKESKTCTMQVSYQILVSAGPAVNPKNATDPGKLTYGVVVNANAFGEDPEPYTLGPEYPHEENNVKKPQDFPLIDLTDIMFVITDQLTNTNIVKDGEWAKNFKSLHFQLVTTYHAEGNDQVSYSKVAKVAMPKFLAPQPKPTP